MIKLFSFESKAFQVDIFFLEATLTSNFWGHSFHGNTKLFVKNMMQYLMISFIGDINLDYLRT